MKTKEKDILLIEDFLDGKLEGDQLKDFNDKLKSDKYFAELFKTRKKLEPEYRKAVEYEQLKNTVGDIIRQESRTFMGIKPVWAFSVAASIIILVGIALILQWSNNDTPSPSQLVRNDSVEILNIDEPEKYALKEVLSATLTYPIKGESFSTKDSIPLRWASDAENEADLFIMSTEEKVILITKRIKLADEIYALEIGILPEGRYSWYIDDSVSRGSFVIVK